ncbi:probable methyltransferase-like protein 24 isoform X2 [Mus musculus]|uniref:probable methyltransferase-like protein 24 isoform X2 n=1 Tax=Mus musculus TaxID=10090 RepID=UPI0003D6E153|nr:probable methyltransferase-like protein 24 isoform X2 [Mus musculus]|eukprot:XP_006512829.1 PREDICTED: methyltransferase-like protein 24 isoform X2 [Mus musculus]
MATVKPPGRGCGALPRWLLGAALLLGLRLCMELRHAGSGPPGRGDSPGPPRTHLLSAPGSPRGARRRQVTYVRSGRRVLPRGGGSTTSPEPSCCAQGGLLRRKIACDHMGTDSLATDSSPAPKPWLVCLDDRFGLAHQIRSKRCRLYSLGLGSDDTHFEVSMANGGCEVHRFDPSVKSAHVLERQGLWHHRLSIDWRDPHPAVAAQKPHGNTRKLGSILNEFGHHKIDVLKADLESAEWKVLENLILEDVLEQIGQLVFEIHLHWPGFEVSGSESGVVRFWYSLLKELERKHFRLFHTYKDLTKPQLFLKKDLFNASSCYTLSWVNTKWR